MPMPMQSSHVNARYPPRRPVPGAPVTTAPEIERLVAGEHADPHSVLGAHPAADGTVVRAFRPAAVSVRVLRRGASPSSWRRSHPAGVFEGDPAGQGAPRLPPRGRLPGRHDRRAVRDPYAFLPTLGELDLHLIAEGATSSCRTRSARIRASLDGAPGTAFAVWAPARAPVSVVGDFNGWDERAHPMRTLGVAGVWELFVPEAGVGPGLQVRDPRRRRRRPAQGRPAGPARRAAAATGSIVFEPGHVWRDDDWLARERRPSRTPRRCRSTRCTSARGASTRSRATARSPTPSSPTSSPTTRSGSASRTSSCCR